MTAARARVGVVAATGSRAVSIYGMGEIGRIGVPCGNLEAVGDVHLLVDKLGVIQRSRRGAGAAPVPVNVYTALVASTPKLMLNVDSDDFVLPARFGGGPTDYQLVEDEDASGLPRVHLFVSPRLGPLPDAAIVDTVVAYLNDAPSASGAYGDRWREGDTLRVARREPYATSASKVMALHTRRPKAERLRA